MRPEGSLGVLWAEQEVGGQVGSRLRKQPRQRPRGRACAWVQGRSGAGGQDKRGHTYTQ